MSLYEEIAGELKQGIQTTISTAQQLYNFFQNFNKGSEIDKNIQKTTQEVLSKDISGFSFTGKYTDLCYFSQSNVMPLNAIENISDPKLKVAVVDNFDKCINNNLLELNKTEGCLTITDKGKNIINQKSFIEQAKKDQLKAYNLSIEKVMNGSLQKEEVQMCVGLSGDYMNDFTFFNHSDKMNLATIINHPDKQLSQKILANVKQWANKGAVIFDQGTVKITEAGKQMLKMPEFKASVTPLIEKAVGSAGMTGKAIVATKKVLDTTIKSVRSVNNSLKK